MPKLRPPKPENHGIVEPKPHENVDDNAEPDLFEAGAEDVKPAASSQSKVKEVPGAEENPLQKQLEALKKSEAVVKEQNARLQREREEAIRSARDREAEVAKFQKEASQSRGESISATIAAASAEIASALKDIKEAKDIADTAAESEAIARLTEAQGNLRDAKRGQAALEAEAKEAAEAPKNQTKTAPTTEQIIDGSSLPDVAKQWLRAHPEFISDPRKNARIQALHNVVVGQDDKEAYSPEYFEAMEERLGMKEKPKKSVEDDEQDNNGGSIVSAPVSREVPDSSGKRSSDSQTLTVAQREAAKMSGITEVEYAKQLQRMKEMKANGLLQS